MLVAIEEAMLFRLSNIKVVIMADVDYARYRPFWLLIIVDKPFHQATFMPFEELKMMEEFLFDVCCVLCAVYLIY
jgi:hypothetical protein